MLRRAVTHVPHVPLPSSIRASGQPPVTALRCCANGARPRGWSNALEGGEGLSRALSGCFPRTPAHPSEDQADGAQDVVLRHPISNGAQAVSWPTAGEATRTPVKKHRRYARVRLVAGIMQAPTRLATRQTCGGTVTSPSVAHDRAEEHHVGVCGCDRRASLWVGDARPSRAHAMSTFHTPAVVRADAIARRVVQRRGCEGTDARVGVAGMTAWLGMHSATANPNIQMRGTGGLPFALGEAATSHR